MKTKAIFQMVPRNVLYFPVRCFPFINPFIISYVFAYLFSHYLFFSEIWFE